MRKETKAIKAVTKLQFLVNVELNQLTNEIIYALFTVGHTLSFNCSVQNGLGRNHYAHCALKLSCRPNNAVRIHRAEFTFG